VSNVTALPGCRVPSQGPNGAVVEALRDLLSRAEAGELQSFIGTGFTQDGLRCAVWCDHANVYEMLGSLAWLQAEYVQRRTA